VKDETNKENLVLQSEIHALELTVTKAATEASLNSERPRFFSRTISTNQRSFTIWLAQSIRALQLCLPPNYVLAMPSATTTPTKTTYLVLPQHQQLEQAKGKIKKVETSFASAELKYTRELAQRDVNDALKTTKVELVLAELEAARKEHVAAMAKRDADISVFKEALAESKQAVAAAAAASDRTEELDRLQQQCGGLRLELQTLEVESKGVAEKLEASEAIATSLRAEIAALDQSKELEKLQEQRGEMRLELETLKAESRGVVEKLDASEAVAAALRAEIEVLHAAAVVAQADTERAMSTLQRKGETIKALKSQMNQLREKVASQDAVLQTLGEKDQALKQELATTRNDVARAGSSIEEREENFAELSLKAEELKGKLFTMAQTVDQLEAEKLTAAETIASMEARRRLV
jgi:chromosome segregation ATPase